MPIYSYRKANGELVQFAMTLAEKALREGPSGVIMLDDGTKAKRDICADLPQGGNRGKYPLASRAAAVHPVDVAEATEHAKTHGVPTNFDGMGHPIFESYGHQRRYLKTVGMRNMDGYYD